MHRFLDSPLSAYLEVRRCTEALAAPLSPEDQTAQSMPDVSPTKWHRAHTTWFFETFVLEQFEHGFTPFEPAYRELFNSYYEAVGPRFPRPDRGVVTRPGAEQVGEYRAAVDERIVALLDRSGLERSDTVDPDLERLIVLGVHHEQQHQELLLMDIKHVLSMNPIDPVYRALPVPPNDSGRTLPLQWVDVDGGLVHVGAGSDDDSFISHNFTYDNEGPRHRVHLEPYRLADRLVTAGEWQDFIDDGGYRRPELWLSDGWAAVQQHAWEAPLYWRRPGSSERNDAEPHDDDGRDDGHDDDRWWVFTLGGARPTHPAEPVCHVSFFEADAYARWAGARLPTEFEWEHAAATVGPWEPCTFDPDRLHPWPAAPPAPGRIDQLTNAAWQWTASAYLPYPGFAPDAGAVGEYNGKFMSGQMVLRGGSAITPTDHTRTSYRNFFPPDARWPMTGVRLADGGRPR